MRTIDPTIGKRLAAIRRHRKLSQGELAAMVGTSKSAIYRYEHGNSRIWPSLLSAMASALRCRISDLLAPIDAPLPDVKFRRRIKSAAAHPSGSTRQSQPGSAVPRAMLIALSKRRRPGFEG